jgi:hypothetical protein
LQRVVRATQAKAALRSKPMPQEQLVAANEALQGECGEA